MRYVRLRFSVVFVIVDDPSDMYSNNRDLTGRISSALIIRRVETLVTDYVLSAFSAFGQESYYL